MANLTGPRGRQERQLPTTPQGQAPLLPHPPSTPNPRVRVSDSSLMKGWRRRAGEERHKKATSNQRMTEKFALSISFPPPSTRYRRPCPCKHRNYGPPGISPDPYIHTRNVMDAGGDRERKRFFLFITTSFLMASVSVGART